MCLCCYVLYVPRSVLPNIRIFSYFYGFCITSTVVRNGVDFYGSLKQQESLLFAAFCGYYILEVMSVGVKMKVYMALSKALPSYAHAPSLLWRNVLRNGNLPAHAHYSPTEYDIFRTDFSSFFY